MRDCESEILYVLGEFGTLKRAQIEKLLSKREINDAEKVINCLLKRNQIWEKDGYLSAMPKPRVNTRMWAAFDVLLEFIPRVKPEEYFAAHEPAHILFIRDDEEFIIVSIFTGDESNISLMSKISCFDDKSNYIVAVNNADIIKTLPEMPSRTIYALNNDGNVSFYEKEKGAK